MIQTKADVTASQKVRAQDIKSSARTFYFTKTTP